MIPSINKNVLVVIPARGGSKGIPRKNLRLLFGKPLIYYSIKNALNSKFNPTVIVTTDDDEIGLIAQKVGSIVHKRSSELSGDTTTLDPVVFDAFQFAKNLTNKNFDVIVTLQPTSPLLSSEYLDLGIEKMLTNLDIDTIISVKNDTHLSWSVKDGKYFPNYTNRVNRQYLKPVFTETGGFLITRSNLISANNRIGKNVDLIVLENGQEIDIDTFNDWNLCEYLLKKRKILFVVAGNSTIGLGHVYNSLIIANDILDHEIEFLVPFGSELALDVIASKNYKVKIQKENNLIDDINNINPSIVINDILDTTEEYVISLKNSGIHVINFEDLGPGSRIADLVFNPIYPESKEYPNHFFGQSYFILRDEFIFSYSRKEINQDVKKILITFGGVDPSNLTLLVLESIYDYCLLNGIKIDIVTGPGYDNFESLMKFNFARIHKNVANISDFMYDADLIFTSAGRTIYEIASIGTPAIVICQNERELTHFFASSQYGFVNLGLGMFLKPKEILNNFKKSVLNFDFRESNHLLMTKQNLKLGRKKVLNLIRQSISRL